jgi:hypothetical protein
VTVKRRGGERSDKDPEIISNKRIIGRQRRERERKG